VDIVQETNTLSSRLNTHYPDLLYIVGSFVAVTFGSSFGVKVPSLTKSFETADEITILSIGVFVLATSTTVFWRK